MKQHIFLIDLDVIPPKKWMKHYEEIIKLILNYFNLKFNEMLIHRSKICRDCGKSKTDFFNNLKNYKKCMFCGSKRLKYGRGLHIFVKATGRKITTEEQCMIQFYLYSDCHKELLGLKKSKKGLPYFNKLFSFVIYRKPPKPTCVDCKIRQNVMKLLGKF